MNFGNAVEGSLGKRIALLRVSGAGEGFTTRKISVGLEGNFFLFPNWETHARGRSSYGKLETLFLLSLIAI